MHSFVFLALFLAENQFGQKQIFTFIAFLACALAEPPVGGGYPKARLSHDHNRGLGIQRVLPQDLGAAGALSQKGDSSAVFRSQLSSYFPASRSSVSQEYAPPELRSSLSQEYSAPGLRSNPSQEYGVPSAPLSQHYGPPHSKITPSTEYRPPSFLADFNIPSARLSQEYGVPQLKDSEQYKTIGDVTFDFFRAPLQRSPSHQYRQPEFQSNPSEEYSILAQNDVIPIEKSIVSSQNLPGFRSIQNENTLSSHNSVQSRQKKPPSVITKNFGSRNAGPQSLKDARPVVSRYLAPVTGNSNSVTPKTETISQSYLPSSGTVSETYGAPNERSLSAEYGPPEAKPNSKTSAFASSHVENRSNPSLKYGVPSVRDAIPSDQYGMPDQYDSHFSQGYNYARNALDNLNQEPASYDFEYIVNDFDSGSDFGHTESRQDNKVEGSYFLVLPDGTKQVIEYEADERGFRPRISVEPAEVRSGYNDNASDLNQSEDGPY